MRQLATLFIMITFIVCTSNLHAQQLDSTASLASTPSLKNEYFYCDSITYADLVISRNWLKLPKAYQFNEIDTIIGVGKIKCNTLLTRFGKIVAYGNLNSKHIPEGNWLIKSTISNAESKDNFCMWGKMKNGIKKGYWWGLDGFYIRFYKNNTQRIGHNQWRD